MPHSSSRCAPVDLQTPMLEEEGGLSVVVRTRRKENGGRGVPRVRPGLCYRLLLRRPSPPSLRPTFPSPARRGRGPRWPDPAPCTEELQTRPPRDPRWTWYCSPHVRSPHVGWPSMSDLPPVPPLRIRGRARAGGVHADAVEERWYSLPHPAPNRWPPPRGSKRGAKPATQLGAPRPRRRGR